MDTTAKEAEIVEKKEESVEDKIEDKVDEKKLITNEESTTESISEKKKETQPKGPTIDAIDKELFSLISGWK